MLRVNGQRDPWGAEGSLTGASVCALVRAGLSVKDYGAVGDGVADDAAALNRAVAAAINQSRTLYFPAGNL